MRNPIHSSVWCLAATLCALLASSQPSWAANVSTQVTLHWSNDADARPIVRFAIPLAEGAIRRAPAVELKHKGEVLSEVHSTCLLRAHWSGNSCLSVGVWFSPRNREMRTLDVAIRSVKETSAEIAGRISEPATSLTEYKGTLVPQVLVTLDPIHLSSSGIAGPVAARRTDSPLANLASAQSGDGDDRDLACLQAFAQNRLAQYLCFWDQHFETGFKNIQLPAAFDATSESFLGDKMSVYWLQYLRTGDVGILREAHAATRHYMSRFCENGRWNKNVSGGESCDGKYVYIKPLFFMLVIGGERQLVQGIKPSLRTIANRAWPAQSGGAFRFPGDEGNQLDPDDPFTERAAGITLSNQLFGFLLTQDRQFLDRVHRWLKRARAHQMDPGDGLPADGSLRHSLYSHDAGESKYCCDEHPGLHQDDRVWSPWMTNEFVIPALWDVRRYVDESHRQITDELALNLASALVRSGFAEAVQYGEQGVGDGRRWPCNRKSASFVDWQSGAVEPVSNPLYMLYFGSTLPDYRSVSAAETVPGYYSDQHTPGAALTLAWAASIVTEEYADVFGSHLIRVLDNFDQTRNYNCDRLIGGYTSKALRTFAWHHIQGTGWAALMQGALDDAEKLSPDLAPTQAVEVDFDDSESTTTVDLVSAETSTASVSEGAPVPVLPKTGPIRAIGDEAAGLRFAYAPNPSQSTCESAETFGRHAVDINNDNLVDVVTIDHQRGAKGVNRGSCFFLNQSGTQFVAALATQESWYSAGAGAKQQTCGWYNLWVDVDGDGLVDTLGEDSEGGSCFFKQLASAGTVPVFENQMGVPGADTGYPDFYIWDFDGDNDLDVINDSGAINDVLNGRQVSKIPSDNNVAFSPVDINGDGILDLVAPRARQAYLAAVDGELTATEFPAAFAACTLENVMIPTDIDRDGDIDYLCKSRERDTYALFRVIERGESGFRPLTTGDAGLVDSITVDNKGSQAVCDLDNDGFPEVIHFNNYRISRDRRHAGGALAIFKNMGGRGFQKLLANDLSLPKTETGKTGGDCADFDRDGKLDILLPGSQAGSGFAIAFNRSMTGNWVAIQIISEGLNRDCVGCLVYVSSDSAEQVFRILPQYRAGAGLRTIHVGLGEGTAIEVSVQRPGGARQSVLTTDEINRKIEISLVH